MGESVAVTLKPNLPVCCTTLIIPSLSSGCVVVGLTDNFGTDARIWRRTTHPVKIYTSSLYLVVGECQLCISREAVFPHVCGPASRYNSDLDSLYTITV